MIDDNSFSGISKRVDDVEVNERRLGTQLQMVLDQQKKLIHSYYELDSKFKDVAKENKLLRNDYVDLKKRVDYGPNANLRLKTLTKADPLNEDEDDRDF